MELMKNMAQVGPDGRKSLSMEDGNIEILLQKITFVQKRFIIKPKAGPILVLSIISELYSSLIHLTA